ncbi:F-type H+-transporting ATPase subunit a [Parelusimicrobium proximum]|uniref:F0F1 ATP synthase subunit A n=1 Tax=Parelusimicrobium proximum TaxID=3228953 RepID=UPI003D177D29
MIEEMLSHHILDHSLGAKIFGFLPLTSNMAAILVVGVLLCVCLPLIITYKRPKIAFYGVEYLVTFIRDSVVLPNLGDEGRKYTPYFCTLFIFILCANMGGMFPGGRSATGSISVTAGLALTTFFLMMFSGLKFHGIFGYLKTFVPHGTPWYLVPLLFFLEVLGMFTKTIALAFRLFGNMIAGHMVLIAFIGIIFIMGAISKWAAAVAVAPILGLSLFINLLEVLVVVLQAYVFTLLTAIFTGAVVHPH